LPRTLDVEAGRRERRGREREGEAGEEGEKREEREERKDTCLTETWVSHCKHAATSSTCDKHTDIHTDTRTDTHTHRHTDTHEFVGWPLLPFAHCK
jgi:hypothetical protein